MLLSFAEMRSKLKGLGLPVFRDVAGKNQAYPYYVYSFVNESKISASGRHNAYLPQYEISLFTHGTEADLNLFKKAFSETPYTDFEASLGDENDVTVTNFHTYIRVMEDE